MPKNKVRKRKIGRILAKVVLGIFLLFVALVLFIRSPWGQDIILGKLLKYVTEKTHTTVTVDRLFVTFSGNLYLEGLYMEDQKGDTLIHSRQLEASIALLPLIRGKKIHLRSLEWSGVKARIGREENEGFNFNFLLTAFSTPTDSLSQKKVDTTAAMAFEIGKIDLNNFDLTYKDKVMGTEAALKLGGLELEMEKLDLDSMAFHIGWAQIMNSKIVYRQTNPLVSQGETGSSVLPSLVVDGFRLNNVLATYHSLPDRQRARVQLGEFLLEMPKADLSSQEITLSTLRIKKSEIGFWDHRPPPEGPVDSTAVTESASFQWPDWKIAADQIDLEENHIVYQKGPAAPQKGMFDPSDVEIRDLNFHAVDLLLKKEHFALDLEQFSFREKSGFFLREMAFDLLVNSRRSSLEDLKISTANSRIQGALRLTYPSVERLLETPDGTKVDLDLDNIVLGMEEAFTFVPALKENPYMVALAQYPLQGKLALEGTLEQLDITDTRFHWGPTTELDLQGTLGRTLDTETLTFDLTQLDLRTAKPDMLLFLNEQELGVSLPDSLYLTGTAKGSLDDMDAKARLVVPEGEILVNGKFANKDLLVFGADIELKSLQLGKLLQNPQLGTISFTAKASGKGSSVNTLDANLTTNFTELVLFGYDFSKLQLNGDIKEGQGHIDLNFKDGNLDLQTRATIHLDSVAPEMELLMDLHGADLAALGITQRDIRTKFRLRTTYKGNPSGFGLQANMTEGVAVYDNASYPMDDISLLFRLDEEGTAATVRSDFLEGTLESNQSPQLLGAALQRHLKGYMYERAENDSLSAPVTMNLDLSLRQAPLFGEVFLEGLQKMDTVQIQMDFREAEYLTANLNAPSIQYNDNRMDSLQLKLNGDRETFRWALELGGLSAGSVLIKKIGLDGTVRDKALLMDFNAYDEGETLVHMASELRIKGDTLVYHIDPSNLILNKTNWDIPSDNLVQYAPGHLTVTDFVLSRSGQELAMRTAVTEQQKQRLELDFSNFRLSTLTHLLNPDDTLVKGTLVGNFTVEDPFGNTGLLADLKVNGLEVVHIPLGNLALDASTKNGSTYNFDLALKEGDVDLDLEGDYIAAQDGARLNMDLLLNELKMKALEQFMEGEVSETAGSISGKVSVRGTTVDPIYEGTFEFNDAALLVNSLNTKFSLLDESLRADNTGIYFDDFTITDANNNTFGLDGTIGTKDLLEPTFDLKIKARNFQVINATKEDNERYYGKVGLNADISLTGNLSVPQVKGNLAINEGSNFTFVIPESQLEVMEREGVVIFVNKENPDDILTTAPDESAAKVLTGFQIDAVLKVDNNSTFTIVIDERTGDNFQISGKGDFALGVEPNGRTTLSGRYVVESGHYEASLYNLVRRRFEISPGSTIVWNGDPMDAALNVRAIYRVETSAAPLMAANNAASSAAENSRYKQVMPFLVYLNLDGSLLQPEISFDLDIPEEEQGSLGGNVYAQVQQLNKQEEELNKQVFSLLVLNRFFPGSTSDGSSGGAASIARDNVNKVLSGQLNDFSKQLMGNTGVDLDFGLESYTDYQGDAPEDRTQLDINASKRLFNDRLIVQVGSEVDIEGSGQTNGESTPVIGNVSLEYLLTENGRFRLRGFRKNEFESVIDGQLIVTGFALIFNREFNKFKELWIKQLREEEKAASKKRDNTDKKKEN